MNGLTRMLILGAFYSCLAMARSASADAVGLVVEDATDQYAKSLGLWVCIVSVEFEDATDRLLYIAFADITTNDPGGFFQYPSPYGTDKAPPQEWINQFPDLAYDSFVTIGLKVVPIGGLDTTTPDPDWDSYEFNNHGAAVGGWFNSSPANGQGAPDQSLEVLIGQFTVDKGYYVFGDLIVLYNYGFEPFEACFQCFFCECPGDLDCDDLVGASDMSLLLGAWGPNPCHPADLDGDGIVGSADLAILLGNWGDC